GRLLDEQVRMRRDRAADDHDERDRPEGRGRPACGAVPAQAPLPDRGEAERGERDQVDVAEYLGGGVQRRSGARTVGRVERAVSTSPRRAAALPGGRSARALGGG